MPIYVKLDENDYIISACKADSVVNAEARGLFELAGVSLAQEAMFRKYDRKTKTAGEKRPE